ncbi:FUSC family protein [Scopulibacillus cellulosilyticus]|uniref:Aromatic acid exporter family protein n=1 Tax=Scopulibacillus cellulosilyticus TaxID=2665665 RepID=A0ABW2Q6N1_9BACL
MTKEITFKMRLGARSLKTGLAVAIALIISSLLSTMLHFSNVTMSGIAAAVATQPSVRRSLRTMVDNVQGNIIGAIIAILFVKFIGSNPIIVGLAVIIVIVIMLKMRLHSTINLTMVTVIVIMAGLPPKGNFTDYALDRIILVLIGVVCATVVNIVFLPPNYENRLYYKILNQTNELFKWIRLISQHASEHTKIKQELAAFDENKLKIDNYYHWYKEERNYLKKHRFAKHRRSVIFRQMMATTNKLHDILKILERNEQDFHHLPESFKEILQKRLEGLMNYHERILLKFNGKIRDEHHEEHAKDTCKHKMKITESFIDFYDETAQQHWLNLFPLIAAIVAYSQLLEHLDMLVESFQTYHKKANRINLVEENEE